LEIWDVTDPKEKKLQLFHEACKSLELETEVRKSG
jgi:hypothetical protein